MIMTSFRASSCLVLGFLALAGSQQSRGLNPAWFKGDGDFPFSETNVQSQIPFDILQQVSELANSSQFIDNFILNKGEIGVESTFNEDELSGKITPQVLVSSRGVTNFRPKRIAQYASCEPSLQVVEIVKENNLEPQILYYPTCTRVKRCGGCCPSPLLQCLPSQSKTITLQVIRTRYARSSAKPFDLERFEEVKVREDVKCKCQCKVKPEDCNGLQKYKINECRCECVNQRQANSCVGNNKFWDSSQCACKCKNAGDQCSTGFAFNKILCRCVPDEANDVTNDNTFIFGRSLQRKLPGREKHIE